MRKVSILIASLLFSFNLFSQTYQPSKQKLEYFKQPVFLDEQPDFKQSNFTFGWHWASAYKMSKALGVNQIHINADYDSAGSRYYTPTQQGWADSSKMIINLSYIGHHYLPWNISRNIAYVYEPTYHVPENPTLDFTPRAYDTTRYAFGFKTVHGFIDTTKNAVNYDRFQLFDSDSLRDSVVLAEPWRCDEYFTMITCDTAPGHKIINSDTMYNIYNKCWRPDYNYWKKNILPVSEKLSPTDWLGVNFYFNINLRRLDDNDIAENNDTILEIKLPYITGGTAPTTGCIRFSMVPDFNYTDTTKLSFGRGIVRNMHARTGDTVLYITRNMIPKGNEADRDITISAFFECDNKYIPPLTHNRGLKYFPYTSNSDQIYSIKTEVKYRGGCNVGIDWLSINTKSTRELATGAIDNTIKKKIQECLDSTTTTAFTSRDIMPFRWYLKDEPNKSYWFARQYMTKLMGRIFLSKFSR